MSPKTKKIWYNFEAKAKSISIIIMMLLVAVTGMFIIPPSDTVVKADAYPGSCSYYRLLTIDHTQVDTALTNFPVCVLLDDDTVMYDDVKANLTDIEFWDSTNTTQFYHEIEEGYINGGGVINATIWVNVTSISADTDTNFYLWYGNASDSDANGYYPEYVWDTDYACVYHLDEASGTIYDSTNNNIDSTAQEITTYQDTGKAGVCVNLDGTNDYINFGDVTDFDGSAEIHIMAWGDHDTELSGAESSHMCSKSWGSFCFSLIIDDADASDGLMSYMTDIGSKTIGTTGNLDTAGWFMGSVAIDDTSNLARLYYNGAQEDTATETDVIPNTDDYFTIGYNANLGNSGHFWDGKLDEIRVSTVFRGEDYLQSVYNTIENQSGANPFVIFGAEGSQSDATSSIEFGSNPSDYFTTSGVVGSSYYANETGTYYETAELTITINSGYIEYIRINVSDIHANLTADLINISFDDDNLTWSGNWHSCTGGGESIIVNGTNWAANNWMSGNNPFSADGDGDGYTEFTSGDSIFWRVRVTYPAGIGTETYSKTDMTYDGGHYS